MHIKTIEQTLTDGSKVYDVSLSVDGKSIRVPCYSQDAAVTLVGALEALFEKYSLEPVTIR
jgi:hypothetical protein